MDEIIAPWAEFASLPMYQDEEITWWSRNKSSFLEKTIIQLEIDTGINFERVSKKKKAEIRHKTVKKFDDPFQTGNAYWHPNNPVWLLKTKKGIQCIVTNSRHCSFGYDQRVELFGSKGMVISENQRDLETTTYFKNSTGSKRSFKNFFIERYSEAFINQLSDLARFCKKNIKPRANFEDGRMSVILAETAKKSLKTKNKS